MPGTCSEQRKECIIQFRETHTQHERLRYPTEDELFKPQAALAGGMHVLAKKGKEEATMELAEER
ncbi:hypothetical protein FIBSPDRAFT_968024 [Athelia psychrophila]|uniref:Uncharacterized protein n=1 Tax=Athelia psychrophila TaxID=1759441 RepID=A0A167V2A9_9AGAM|nr:hypothetical protein FIBSPDRAFT_968024 [Fibularhizoctonia sp. CBS 109695]